MGGKGKGGIRVIFRFFGLTFGRGGIFFFGTAIVNIFCLFSV